MTDYEKLYRGISKTAWGYFFLYFNININSVSLLPSFVGFLLFLSAINLLRDEERDLMLLHPLATLLALWHGTDWIFSLFGWDLDGFSSFLDLIVSLVNLYFHFQLLTNLASIAAKHQPEGMTQDEKLLKYRTMQTIMLTAIMILGYLFSWLTELWAIISFCLLIVYIIVCICIMKALFNLRSCLPGNTR